MFYKRGFLLPHPPIVIDKIGKTEISKCQQTKEALEKVAREIKAIEPETIVVISPHGTIFSDAVSINFEPNLSGDLLSFGHPELKLSRPNDLKLAEEIYSESLVEGVNCAALDQKLKKRLNISTTLDHGVIVPLYYLDEIYKKFKIVHINYGILSAMQLYRFGMAIKNAVESLERKTVVIASGDLSHKLSNQGPYSYAEEGPRFDKKLIQYLDRGMIEEIITMDADLIKKAGECGKRSINILCGTLEGLSFESDVYSYEGPFGVGYGVVSFSEFHESDRRKLALQLERKLDDAFQRKIETEDIYVQLARKTINTYINTGQKMDVEIMDLPEEMLTSKAGVFVSIKKNGALRGCIGTTGVGVEKNIAEEIIRNAIQASTKDPRFPAVEPEELNKLEITVDVLEPSEVVESLEELDPKKYGVIVEKDFRKALLLPNLEGIDTVEKQLEVVLNKAGISKTEDYSVEKFRVVRHY